VSHDLTNLLPLLIAIVSSGSSEQDETLCEAQTPPQHAIATYAASHGQPLLSLQVAPKSPQSLLESRKPTTKSDAFCTIRPMLYRCMQLSPRKDRRDLIAGGPPLSNLSIA